MEGKTLDIGVEIHCNKKKSLAGNILFGLVDLKTRRGIEIPQEVKDYFIQDEM